MIRPLRKEHKGFAQLKEQSAFNDTFYKILHSKLFKFLNPPVAIQNIKKIIIYLFSLELSLMYDTFLFF